MILSNLYNVNFFRHFNRQLNYLNITKIRNSKKLVRCISFKHDGKASSVTSSLFSVHKDKDLNSVKVPSPKPENRENVQNIIDFIKNTTNLKDLERFLEESSFDSVDDRDIGTLFNVLFNVIRFEKSDVVKKDFATSVGVQRLYKITRNYARWLNPGEIITVIKFLAFLNTPGNNVTLQMLLRLLSKHANSLTLSEILYTSFLLQKVNSSTIVSALKMAMPIILENYIKTKLEKNDVANLAEAFRFAVDNNMSDSAIQKLVDSLISNMDALSPQAVLSCIWSATELRRRVLRLENLIPSALKKVTESYDGYEFKDMNITASKLSKRYHRNNAPYFYDEDFVGKFCQSVVEQSDNDQSTAVHTLRSVTNLKHVDVAYLDRLSDIILSNPSLILNNDYLFSVILRGFSGANYKPDAWKKLEPILLNHPFLTKDVSLGSIPVALDFMILDSFPSNLIEKLFSPFSFPILEEHVTAHSPHVLFMILKGIKTLCPSYKGPLPANSLIENWKQLIMSIPKNYSLKEALESGIGGGNYVISGVFHEGLHLDHAIIFRKGGYPIAMDVSQPVNLKDLQMSAENDLLLVKALVPEAFASNTNRLRGMYSFENRLIESFGYPVITIDIARWKEFPDSEKIPYLMRQIREKLDVSSEAC